MLNNGSDVYLSIDDEYINRIIKTIFVYRPSLFNYATIKFEKGWLPTCSGIDGVRPFFTPESPLIIPGSNGALGMEYCLQIGLPKIDFYPNDIINLPAELEPLKPQSFAISGKLNIGIACPKAKDLDNIAELIPEYPEYPDPENPEEPIPKPDPITVPADKVICWPVDFHVIAKFAVSNSTPEPMLIIKMLDFALEGVGPKPLEEILECYIGSALRVGLIRRVKTSLNILTMNIAEFGLAELNLTSISTDLPFNPAIESNELRVYSDLRIFP